MGKQQVWSVTACVFLLLTLTSHIECRRRVHRIRKAKLEPPSSGARGKTNVKDPNKGHIKWDHSKRNPSELRKHDLIQQLPGQPPVSFKQYGGYVAINQTAGRFFYYYFVEAVQVNNSSPLVVWFNGGPGCSSLQGAFLEHGPFRVHSDGKTLYQNPYSWNNVASVLYIESPAEVGFSFTNTPSDLEELDDDNTADDNSEFLLNWLDRFPEYKTRELYITGQSYAGHYVPQLAQMITDYKNETSINLQGVLIGNPELDYELERKGEYDYLLNHALISQDNYDRYYKKCVEKEESTMEVCKAALDKINDQTKDLNIFSIYAPVCLNSTLTNTPNNDTTITKFDPCSLGYLTAYLNLADVQVAMRSKITQLPRPWKKCSDSANEWNDEDLYGTVIPTLKDLISKGVRIWLYSGDTDAVIPHTSTMDVLRSMNLTAEKTWRPWFVEGEIGGYTQEYKEKITYATVREAGHNVPSDQPIRALTLFTNFIRNTPLPVDV